MAFPLTAGLDAEIRLNALKEELQFYVLDFVYHHPEYNEWIMYGGSALRICMTLIVCPLILISRLHAAT